MASLEYFEAISSSNGQASQLVVQHTHERSCWAALPPALCSRLFQAQGAELPLALELRTVQRRGGASLPSDAPLFVAWAGAACSAGCVGVPSGLARALGLAEGSSVAVRPLPGVPPAVSVSVEPASEDDWEVVQLNAEYLEEQLLNQVGVASPHQPLPFWIRGTCVVLRVTALEPAAPVARLVRGSEIYVAPRPRVQPALAAAAGAVVLPGPSSSRSSSQAGADERASRCKQRQQQQQQAQQAQQEGEDEAEAAAAPLQAVLRVQLAADSADFTGGAQQAARQLPPGMQVVHASSATLARCGLRTGDWVRVAGRACRSLTRFARLEAWEAAAPGHLALTEEQCDWAGAPPGSHLRLQRLAPDQRQLIREAAELRGTGGGAGSAAQNGGDGGEAVGQRRQLDEAAAALAPLSASGWLRAAAERALQRLLPVLAFTPRSLLQGWCAPRPGGLLVTGPPGSGKSALLAAAAAALGRHPDCLTHTVTVRCRHISAEGASQARAQVLPGVLEALQHLPALLVLEDLDVLCPAGEEGGQGAAAPADPALLAWLCALLDHLAHPGPHWGRLHLPPHARGGGGGGAGAGAGGQAWPACGLGPALWPPLAVAATCRSAATLAAPLRAAGRLDCEVALPPPSAASRAAILAAAAAERGAALQPRQVRQLAERADGFDAADLSLLLDRAMHVALRRRLSSGGAGNAGGHAAGAGQCDGGLVQAGSAPPGPPPPSLHLEPADLEAALEGFTPAAFWGTGSGGAVQAGVEGWADVGGMEEARQALHEALELPTKYARLVAQAPLRLRTGVLLYGPPGCGKTHVVAAAVAAAGVRCITVSGPELLNKYIGASEAAVRDVFQRAAAAAPCLLFFDEFDAIAPQRGHDNTGVTDRVVNQLLTELDGVEGLKGVCVVGATSRPDLLDAALLRPGRLDRHVLCGFPSPLERGAVLRALSRGVQLAPDVDLGQLGYNAEFFSCADLAALLAEAQLAAVHEALEGESGRPPAAAAGPPVIQRRHLEVALAEVRPSVAEGERERLEAVYARFSQDRERGPGGAAARDKGKGKVTWA